MHPVVIPPSTGTRSMSSTDPVFPSPPSPAVVRVPASLGCLHVIFSPFNKHEPLHPALTRRYTAGKFSWFCSHPGSTRHMLFRGSDEGIILYHVPAASFTRDYRPVLLDAVNRIRRHKVVHRGVYHGIPVQRHYLVQCASSSIHFCRIQARWRCFIADTKPFWEEASVVFRNVWPTIRDDFTKYDLSPDTP